MSVSYIRAREILKKHYPLDPARGSFQLRKEWNLPAKTVEWWMAGGSAHGTVLDRDLRYLAAYREIATEAGNYLWATGLPLDDGFLWYDRAVMATLLEHGFLELRNEKFEVTERAGHLLNEIAPPSESI